MSTATHNAARTITLDGFPEPPAWASDGWEQDGENLAAEYEVGTFGPDDRTIYLTVNATVGVGEVHVQAPHVFILDQRLDMPTALDLYIGLRKALALTGIDLEQDVPTA